MNVGIIGLGLIGASMARTIHLHTDCKVWGTDLSEEVMREAVLTETIDAPLNDSLLRRCELVLVALYPGEIIRWVELHADCFAEGCTVIDCGGIKQRIVSALQPLADTKGWHFIGGHPMAGREFSGIKYARDDLFDNASMILTPSEHEDPAVCQRAKEFFLDLGFRRVQFTTPLEHDEMIAYTSQLAHVVSSAYVKCPLASKHRGFSAGSFADMTRVARLNEDMWTELFLDNRDALLPEVSGLIERLTAYRDALEAQNAEQLRALLREGREIKEQLSE